MEKLCNYQNEMNKVLLSMIDYAVFFLCIFIYTTLDIVTGAISYPIYIQNCPICIQTLLPHFSVHMKM